MEGNLSRYNNGNLETVSIAFPRPPYSGRCEIPGCIAYHRARFIQSSIRETATFYLRIDVN